MTSQVSKVTQGILAKMGVQIVQSDATLVPVSSARMTQMEPVDGRMLLGSILGYQIRYIGDLVSTTVDKCFSEEKKNRIRNNFDQLDDLQLSDSVKQQIQTEAAANNIPFYLLEAYYRINDPRAINLLKSVLDNFELNQEEISCAKTADALCKINRKDTKMPLFLIKKINQTLENYRPVITKAKQVINKNLNSSLKNCNTSESREVLKEFISEYNKLLQNLYRTLYM
jgi:hypothetical protein